MAGGHGDWLLVRRESPVHALPAHLKVLAAVAFVLVVVSTPPERGSAFAAYAVLLAAVVALARVPALTVVRRMVVEVPFVLFALVLPFVAPGERVDVLGVGLSEAGLLGAWNILAKASLGVVASIVLAATTAPRDLLVGLQRLRAPALLVQIAAFMLRYADLVLDDLRRMRVARESRGFQARHLGHLPVLARSSAALFVRTYERGERVHLAMLARGYTGRMPLLDDAPVASSAWAAAGALPASALAVALLTWWAG